MNRTEQSTSIYKLDLPALKSEESKGSNASIDQISAHSLGTLLLVCRLPFWFHFNIVNIVEPILTRSRRKILNKCMSISKFMFSDI